MQFLRGFNSRDDIEHLLDHNQHVIDFNGYLYDITTDNYRRINKDDFITKTMCIPYNINIPDSKAGEGGPTGGPPALLLPGRGPAAGSAVLGPASPRVVDLWTWLYFGF
jgi:hypothetical protein